ncbi:MAG: hypothetical protein AB8H80_16815 [Planctomycetota bacterium]
MPFVVGFAIALVIQTALSTALLFKCSTFRERILAVRLSAFVLAFELVVLAVLGTIETNGLRQLAASGADAKATAPALLELALMDRWFFPLLLGIAALFLVQLGILLGDLRRFVFTQESDLATRDQIALARANAADSSP